MAASREKEEAERMQKEKNEALETDRKQFSSPYVNGEPILLNNITLKEVPVNYVMGEDDWDKVIKEMRRAADTRAEYVSNSAHFADAKTLAAVAARLNKILRIIANIEEQKERFCDAIRNPEDDDSPF